VSEERVPHIHRSNRPVVHFHVESILINNKAATNAAIEILEKN